MISGSLEIFASSASSFISFLSLALTSVTTSSFAASVSMVTFCMEVCFCFVFNSLQKVVCHMQQQCEKELCDESQMDLDP